MKVVRQATEKDIVRLAEIEVFNYRLNFYPIFQNDCFYFEELTTVSLMEQYLKKKEMLEQTWVYDDGVVKGFIRVDGRKIEKLFVEPILQGKGIGEKLLSYAVGEQAADHLWALEKNVRAIAFYERHGFSKTDEKILEEGTTEYLVKMKR